MLPPSISISLLTSAVVIIILQMISSSPSFVSAVVRNCGPDGNLIIENEIFIEELELENTKDGCDVRLFNVQAPIIRVEQTGRGTVTSPFTKYHFENIYCNNHPPGSDFQNCIRVSCGINNAEVTFVMKNISFDPETATNTKLMIRMLDPLRAMKLLEISDCLFVFKATTSATNMMTHALFAFADNVNGPSKIHFFNNTMLIPKDAPPMFIVIPCVIALGVSQSSFEFKNVELFLVESNSMIVEQHQFAAGTSIAIFSVLRGLYMPMSQIRNMTLHRNRVISRTASPMVAAHSVQFNIFALKEITGNFNFYFSQNTVDIYNPMEISAGGLALDIMTTVEKGISDSTQTTPVNNILQFSDNNRIQFHKDAHIKIPGTVLNQILSQISIFKLQLPIKMVNTIAIVGNNSLIVDSNIDGFSPTINCLNLQSTAEDIGNVVIERCNIHLGGRVTGSYSALINFMVLVRNVDNIRRIRVENSKLFINNISTGAVPGVMSALTLVFDVKNVQEMILSGNSIEIRHAGEEETSSVSARTGMLCFSRVGDINRTHYEFDARFVVNVTNCNITFTHLAGLYRSVASTIVIIRSEADSISATDTSFFTVTNNRITVVDQEIVDGGSGSLVSSPRGQSQPIVAIMYATTDFLASNPVITRTPWSFMFKDNSITFRGATRDTNPANYYSKVTVEIFALVSLTSSDGIANFTLDRNNADVIIGSQRIKNGGNLVLSFSVHVLRIRGGLNHGIYSNVQLIQTDIVITNNNISSRSNTSQYASMGLLNLFEGPVPRDFAVKEILLEKNIVNAVTKYPVVDYSMMALMLAGRSFGIASKFESKKNSLYGNLLVPIGPQYCFGFGMIASGRILEFLSTSRTLVSFSDTSIHCDVVFPENQNDVMSVVADSQSLDESVVQRYNIGLFSTRGIIMPEKTNTPFFEFNIQIRNCDATLGTSTTNRNYLVRNPDLVSSGRIFATQFPLLRDSEIDVRMLNSQDRFPLLIDISETRLHVRGCLAGTKTLLASLLALSSQNLRLSSVIVSKNSIGFVVDVDTASEAIADPEVVEAETVAYSCPDNCSFDDILVISDNVIELPRFRQARAGNTREFGDYYAHFFTYSSSNFKTNHAIIMNGNQIRVASSSSSSSPTQITTVEPLYIGIAFLDGNFVSASGTRSSLSFMGNRIDLTNTRLESTTKNIFVCVLCIAAKHLEIPSSTSASSYNIRLVRNAVLSSSTTQLSAPAGVAVNQNLFRLAVPPSDDGEASSSINSSIFVDTFLIEDNQFRLAPSTSPSSSVVHIEVATLARKHTKFELLNNTFSAPPSPSSSTNSFLNIVIPSSKEFNFTNIIDFDLTYNRELEFSSSASSLIHVNRFVENENEIRDALLMTPSSSSLKNNLNVMLENNTLYDLTKGSKIAAASLSSSSDSSTSYETLLQQLGTNTPAFVFEELNWTIKCNFFSNNAQRYFLKQTALAKEVNTNHSNNRFHLLCDRFDMSPSATKATISQTTSRDETSTHSHEITESISLHANSTTKSESYSRPLSVSSSINTLSSSASESFHENPPKYATFNQVVPPSMLSAVSIISLATMDPSSISFMNKMRMMATICGKDGVPFLPPLSFESNPLGISLGEGRESGDDTSDYRGALLGNSIFLLSFLVIHAAIIVPLFMWYHNKFKVPKKKTNQDQDESWNTNNNSGEHSSGENGGRQQKKRQNDKNNNNSNRNEEKTKEEEQEEQKKASDNPQELIKPFKSLPEASRSTRFPGIIHLPTRVLLSPTIFCIGVVFSIFGYKNPTTFEESFTIQFYRKPDAVEMFALILAFIFFIILLLAVLFYVTRSVSHREELSERKLFFRAAKRGPCPAFTRRLAKIVAPEKSWPPTSALIQRYNDVVKRNSHPQYVPFDVFIEIIIALVNGIAAMAASEASCQAARIVSFICCLVHVVVVCCLNPFLSFSRRKIEPSLSFLSCAFSLVVLISYYVDSVTDKAVNDFLVVAAIIATMVSVESMVKFLVSNYITRCLMTKKEQLKSKGKLTVPQEELKKKKNNNNINFRGNNNNNNNDDDEEEMIEQEYARRRQRGGRGATNNSSVDNIHRLFDAGDLLSGGVARGNKNQLLHGHYKNNHIHLRQLQDPLLLSPPAPPPPKMTKGERERIQKMKKDELKKMRRREVEVDENLLGESSMMMSPIEKKNSRKNKTNNVNDRKR